MQALLAGNAVIEPADAADKLPSFCIRLQFADSTLQHAGARRLLRAPVPRLLHRDPGAAPRCNCFISQEYTPTACTAACKLAKCIGKRMSVLPLAARAAWPSLSTQSCAACRTVTFTLARYHGSERAPAAQVVVHIGKKLCALHGQGWVHRDLKPGNTIWLPSQNEWALIDFGCAARAGAFTGLSFSLYYAPPEVVVAYKAGETVIIPAADVWALGVRVPSSCCCAGAE
jgi:Protein kinase domain